MVSKLAVMVPGPLIVAVVAAFDAEAIVMEPVAVHELKV